MKKSHEEIMFNVNEIFYSIQGEGTRIGLPCVFIRFQGCELRCSWCDTKYALDIDTEANLMNVDAILKSVKSYDCGLICITGGEPLLQKNLNILLDKLIDQNFEVTIETNGHQDISVFDRRAVFIMDLKCPGSGMSKNNRFENINHLCYRDEVKFVIQDEKDYHWARKIIKEYHLEKRVKSVIMSPVFNEMTMNELAMWILKDNLSVRLQMQLHKYIWDPDRRGV